MSTGALWVLVGGLAAATVALALEYWHARRETERMRREREAWRLRQLYPEEADSGDDSDT